MYEKYVGNLINTGGDILQVKVLISLPSLIMNLVVMQKFIIDKDKFTGEQF